MAKKKIETENLKTTQVLSSKTDKTLPLTQFIYKTSLILNLKPQGKNSARVQANAFMLLTKPYPSNIIENPNPIP